MKNHRSNVALPRDGMTRPLFDEYPEDVRPADDGHQQSEGDEYLNLERLFYEVEV